MVRTTDVRGRRKLAFASMGDILDDVEYFASGDPPRALGNWTPAQIVEHVTKFIRCSIDGFDAPPLPLPVRLLARLLLRRRALETPMRPGLKLPRRYALLEPSPNADWEEAVDGLRAVMRRLQRERMTAPSPILGRLTHEQWVKLHCRHAEMHLSFIQEEAEAEPAGP